MYRFEQLARDGDEAEFEIECSSGTYVRSLIADLGDAYCTELRRLAIGPFSADEADEGRRRSLCATRSLVFSDHLVSGAVSIKVTPLTEAERRPRDIAIGTFDGVHVGHRRVIRGADTVLTFEPHPLSIIHPEAAPKLIMPFDIKRDVIEGLGVDELVVIHFDEDFSTTRRRGVLRRDPRRPTGRDQGAGGGELPLRPAGEGRPAHAAGARGVRDRGRPPGRGRRRDGLVDPDPGADRRGRRRGRDAVPRGAFLFEGTVVEGDKRAHARLPDRERGPRRGVRLSGHGVYAAFADGVPAAVNVGVRPTFETGRGVLIEAYLIDHSADLYGRTLRIAFIARLRGEKRFENVDELVAQMRRDVDEARRLCAEFTPPR